MQEKQNSLQRRLNKGFSSQLPIGYPDEGRRAQWPKLCENNNKDNCPNINSVNTDIFLSEESREKLNNACIIAMFAEHESYKRYFKLL